MDIGWPLGGVVARCAHGAAPFLCFRGFYPVKRPTANHSGRCSQMLVDGRQRPLDDASCILKLCTVRARCVRHPLNCPAMGHGVGRWTCLAHQPTLVSLLCTGLIRQSPLLVVERESLSTRAWQALVRALHMYPYTCCMRRQFFFTLPFGPEPRRGSQGSGLDRQSVRSTPISGCFLRKCSTLEVLLPIIVDCYQKNQTGYFCRSLGPRSAP